METWALPAGVAALAALAGWFATRAPRDGERAAIGAAGRRDDLVRTKEAVLAELHTLELERDKLAPQHYESERARLLQEGAGALRSLDEETPAPEPSAPGPLSPELRALLDQERDRIGLDALRAGLERHVGASPGGAPLPWRGIVLALLALAVLGGLFVAMQSDIGPRAPGGSMTGNGPAPAVDPEKARLEEKLAAQPDDVPTLNALTELAFVERDLQRAMQLNGRALELAPEDRDARTYKAVLRAAVGMIDAALADLDAVLAEEPGHTKALVYKGLLAADAGRLEAAADALEKAIASGPAGDGFLEARLAEVRGQMSAEPVVSGTISLAGEAPAQGIVYVSVRDPAGGPPLAAKKLPLGPFPLDFRLTTADAIAMGGKPRAFPAALIVAVRVDVDGDPMTKEPTPSATAEGVAKGAEGLAISLE